MPSHTEWRGCGAIGTSPYEGDDPFARRYPLLLRNQEDLAVNKPLNEDWRTDPEPAEAAPLAESHGGARDQRRLKPQSKEVPKPEAKENPEAGCVAWYRFPDVPEKP